MNSDTSSPEVDPGSIRRHSEAAAPQEPDSEIEEIKRRLIVVEQTSEEVAQAKKLNESLEKYTSYLQEDAKNIRRLRTIITAAPILSTLLFAIVCVVVYFQPVWFVDLASVSKVSFLLVLSSSSVILVSVMLRGVYRSRRDRQEDHGLPEHLREMANIVSRDFRGGSQ